MEEYLRTLTEIAPQWKLSRLLARGDEEKEHEVAKPKRMMWIIRIQFERSRILSRDKSLEKDGLQATSIHIIQGSNASQAKLWFEDVAAEYMESQRKIDDDKSVVDVL